MRGKSARAAHQSRIAPPDGGRGPRTAEGTPSGTWLLRGKDGTLTAYALADGGVLRWAETRPGGPEWSGAEFFPVEHLTHLAICRSPAGYVHFFGRRERPRADGRLEVDIVYATQYQSGRPLTAWKSLGNPHKDVELGRRFGVPAAVAAASDTVHVFVRNAGNGLMLRREEAGGKWSRWLDLKGKSLRDGLAPVAVSSGKVELLAPTEDGVLHWYQPEDGALLKQTQGMQTSALPGSCVGLETAEDRATYYWTDPAGSGVLAYRAGAWPVPLGGMPADGANVALRTELDGHDCVVLAHRGTNGNAMVGVGVTESEQNGVRWSDTTVPCVGDPALALDTYGRVVIAVITPEGAPAVARRQDAPGLTLSDWQML